MGTYIAIDIGGTQIRVAVYPKEGIEPLSQERIATQGEGTPVERLLELVDKLWPSEPVLGIGAAAPGPLDPRKGIIFEAPNIPGWTNLPLKKILEDRFKVPAMIGNDANMAAVGEWRHGAGNGHHNLVYLTISTGIGGGVIMDDRLLLGERGLATELGHVTVDPNGPLCGCGHRGHLEAFASGTAIAKYTAEQLACGRSSIIKNPTPSARDVSSAAEAGDELAIEAFNRAGEYLALGLLNYAHIFNPSIFVLGGGVSRSGPLLFDPLRRNMVHDELSPQYLKDLVITTALLGDDAGLLGTLEMARLMNLERQLIPDDRIS
jgi:glucokinase